MGATTKKRKALKVKAWAVMYRNEHIPDSLHATKTEAKQAAWVTSRVIPVLITEILKEKK